MTACNLGAHPSNANMTKTAKDQFCSICPWAILLWLLMCLQQSLVLSQWHLTWNNTFLWSFTLNSFRTWLLAQRSRTVCNRHGFMDLKDIRCNLVGSHWLEMVLGILFVPIDVVILQISSHYFPLVTCDFGVLYRVSMRKSARQTAKAALLRGGWREELR